MKKIRNIFILIGYKYLGHVKWINILGLKFYVKFLIPFLFVLLRAKHENLVDIQVRNSILDNINFNLFLSDIDTSLVIDDGSDSVSLVKDFLRLKSFFVMLDFPEIYTLSEMEELDKIKYSTSWKMIESFWNIRKINWAKQAMANDLSLLNKIKMTRSVEKSLKKIMRGMPDVDRRKYSLSDLKYLNFLFDTGKKDLSICVYSDYLGNNNKEGIYFEVSIQQYDFFNSLFPGDSLKFVEVEKCSPYFLESRLNIERHERLITLSTIRLKTGKGESSEAHSKWLTYLDERIN